MSSSMVAHMDDPPMPSAPIAVPHSACARCGGPFGEALPVAVPDLCGVCITALLRAFEDRCRWESLAADTLAREAHQRRLGYADTDDARDYDALPPLDRSRCDAAAAVCAKRRRRRTSPRTAASTSGTRRETTSRRPAW